MKKVSGTMAAVMAAVILMGTFIVAQPSTAGEKARDGRFISYDNGTVLDTKTNLMWAAQDNGGGSNWLSAKSYCENYNGGGYADWRMPTAEELEGLYDASIDRKFHLTKLIKLTWGSLWASDIIGSGRNNKTFSFMSGSYGSHNGSTHRALPVRSVK